MGRFYEDPPIIEAVCEFRFQPSQPWDWTILGLFYDRVKKEFPNKKQQNAIELRIHPSGGEIKQQLQMQFWREDEKSLLQVGVDLLTINMLKPYPNWAIFKSLIAEAFAIYKDIAQPKGFHRIGLRYINQINTGEKEARIEDYLRAYPTVPKEIPQLYTGWLQRVDVPFEPLNGILRLHVGSVREEQQKAVSFLLDLDFGTLRASDVALDEALDWVEQAHSQIEQVFEACITDKARTLFKEVPKHV